MSPFPTSPLFLGALLTPTSLVENPPALALFSIVHGGLCTLSPWELGSNAPAQGMLLNVFFELLFPRTKSLVQTCLRSSVWYSHIRADLGGQANGMR